MRKAYLQMHLAILLWGFTAIFGKLISLDSGLLVWYRMLFSTIGTGIFLYFTRELKPIPPAVLMRIAGIGLLITLHWITFYGAIKASNVSIAISCFSSVALFTALMQPLLGGKKPRLSELVLGAGVIAGITLIFSGNRLYIEGIALSVISAFLASLFTILNKQMSGKLSPGTITLYELGTGFLLLTLLLPLWFEWNSSEFRLPEGNDWIYLGLLSIVCTTFAFTLSLHALRRIDAFTMNLSVNLEPLYSIVLAIILFKEHKSLDTGFYAGSLIILATVALHGYLSFQRMKKGPS